MSVCVGVGVRTHVQCNPKRLALKESSPHLPSHSLVALHLYQPENPQCGIAHSLLIGAIDKHQFVTGVWEPCAQ